MSFIQQQISAKIHHALNPFHFVVTNESPMHHVPPGAETHFKLVVVSSAFEGKNAVARHRWIYDILTDVKIHALSMNLFTPEEWEKQGNNIAPSPPCQREKK